MTSTVKHLLIVEDNAHIGNSILNAAKTISNIGNLHVSTTLQEAIYLLNATHINLIILDLSLPDGNGLELLKLLKEKEEKKKVLVFSTSTYLKQVCLKYGAYAFFDKSSDFDELIETIKVVD